VYIQIPRQHQGNVYEASCVHSHCRHWYHGALVDVSDKLITRIKQNIRFFTFKKAKKCREKFKIKVPLKHELYEHIMSRDSLQFNQSKSVRMNFHLNFIVNFHH
jgi:hypothetical protein